MEDSHQHREVPRRHPGYFRSIATCVLLGSLLAIGLTGCGAGISSSDNGTGRVSATAQMNITPSLGLSRDFGSILTYIVNTPMSLVLPSATSGSNLQYTLGLTGADSTYPEGLSFDPSSRTLSGAPAQTGEYSMTYTATGTLEGQENISSFVFTLVIQQGETTGVALELLLADDITLFPGQLLTLTATVRNQGTTPADTTLTFYRSTDEIIDIGDTAVGEVIQITALAASASAALPSVGLTAEGAVGTYYYGACVAAISNEVSTANNCSGNLVVAVTESSDEYFFATLSTNNSLPSAGESFLLSATLGNQGLGPGAATTVLHYYRSTDNANNTASDDSSISMDTVGSIRASGSDLKSLRLATSVEAGIHYYFACIEGASYDSNLGNNCSGMVAVAATGDVPILASTEIASQSYIAHSLIPRLVLPAAFSASRLDYLLTPEGVTLADLGLSFDSSTRLFSGTPIQDGTFNLTYTAMEADGDSASASLTVTVHGDQIPSFPIATRTGDQHYRQGILVADLILEASPSGNAPVSYALTSEGVALAHLGLSFDPGSRVLSGTPLQAGVFRLTYSATDIDADIASYSFTINVAQNLVPSFPEASRADHQSYTQNTLIANLILPDAVGGDAPLNYHLAPENGSLDDLGLRFDTGVLSGTPSKVGVFDLTYSATDVDGDRASYSFSIAVDEQDTAPLFTSVFGDRSFAQGQTVTEVLPGATGGNGGLVYRLHLTGSVGLPLGLTWYAHTHSLAGQPTRGGVFPMSYSATDTDGDSVSQNFTITVDSVPSFGSTTIIDPPPYRQNTAIAPLPLPVAVNGNGQLRYTLTLPSGLGLVVDEALRVLSGTPTTALSPTLLTYTVMDEDGDSASLSFTISVTSDVGPSFGSAVISPQVYLQNTAINPQQLPSATGGNGVLRYTLSDMPTGLNLSETLVFSGTPTVAATTPIIVLYTVTDEDGDSASLSLVITVGVDLIPVFTDTIDPQSYIVNTPVLQTLPQATSGNGALDYTLTPEVGTLAALGLSFDPGTRVLSGTPSTATSGAITMAYTAVDTDGNTATSDSTTLVFTLRVAPDFMPTFPSGSQTGHQFYSQGVQIANLLLPVAVSGNLPLSYSLVPDRFSLAGLGLHFDAGTRVLTGTPTIPGTFVMTHTTTDVDGDTASYTFDIFVDGLPLLTGSVGDKAYTQYQQIATFRLPIATGGDGALTYDLRPKDSALSLADLGLIFNVNSRLVTGTPIRSGSIDLVYTVTDTDANPADSDSDALEFTIVVDAVPVFSVSSVSDQIFIEHVPVLLQLPEAVGGNGALHYSLVITSQLVETPGSQEIPDGLTLDSNTGVLSGTPVQPGTFQMAYTVTDTDTDTASDSQTLSFRIHVDSIPMFADEKIVKNFIENEPLIDEILPAAIGGDGGLLYELVGLLPSGISFNSLTRELSGTPTTPEITSDVYKLVYSVTDTDVETPDDTDSLELEITIEPDLSPTFIGAPLSDQAYLQGHAFDPRIELPSATGGNGLLTYELKPQDSALSLADMGLGFETGTRELSGTLIMPGVFPMTYTVTDADNNTTISDTDSQTFTITVDGSPSLIEQSGNRSYAQDVPITNDAPFPGATGGNGALTYDLRETGSDPATLPVGLIFNSDGNVRTLSGTPTVVGVYSMTYTVTDADGNTTISDSDSETFTITVDGRPSLIGQSGNRSYAQDVPITNDAPFPGATGGNGALTYDLRETGSDPATLPVGLIFNSDGNVRTLSGTPTVVGVYSMTYTVTDADNNTTSSDSDSETFTITVDGRPSLIGQSGNRSYAQDVPITNDAPFPGATGGNGALTYDLRETGSDPATLPVGLIFNSDGNVRTLSGTPTMAGDYSMTYTVTDADGNTTINDSDSETFTITVDGAPRFDPSNTYSNQTFSFTVNEPITAQMLPSAIGGNASLVYDLRITGSRAKLPVGLIFNDDSNVLELSGTPTVTGIYAMSYTVADTDGNTAASDTDFLTFTIIVQGAVPLFENYDAIRLTFVQNFTPDPVQLPTAVGSEPITYKLIVQQLLHQGLAFNSNTGVISGTPTVHGITSFEYVAVDINGNESLPIALTIESQRDTTPSLSDATYTFEYDGFRNTPLPLADRDPSYQSDSLNLPLSYTLTGTLPSGLSTRTFGDNPNDLNTELRGASTESGTHTLTWTVEDMDGDTASSTITIIVENPPPLYFGLVTFPSLLFHVGNTVSKTLPAASGGDSSPITYSFTVPDNPFRTLASLGLSFDSNTRTLSGSPTEQYIGYWRYQAYQASTGVSVSINLQLFILP